MFGSLVSGILGTGLGVYQAIQGSKDKKRAERALNDYERQSLDNAFENIQVSTVGSDLMREESGRTTSNLVDATRNAGLRGILGGIPKIQAGNNSANQEARKYLDDQVNQRQYAIAEDNVKIRGIKENRDNANIAALSSEVNAGKQDIWNGMIGAYKGVSSLANNFNLYGDKLLLGDGSKPNVENKTASNNTINPVSSIYGPNNFSAPPNIVSKSFYETNDSFPNNFSTPNF